MKVVLSGGHLTPALAVIHAFRRISPKTRLIFIGREFAQEHEGMKTRERTEMNKLRIPFYAISAAKFHRTHFLRNFGELLRLIPSLKGIYDIFKQEKPDVFISFGGYLAVPIAIVARALGIPVITHEQTRTCGLANQLIAQFADKVAISYEHSRKYFPKEKIVFTGNPVRPAFMEVFRKRPVWLTDVPLNKPLVYITGGSQGSYVLNQTVKKIIDILTRYAVVLHQCGASAGSEYFQDLQKTRSILTKPQQKRYIVREWVGEEDVAWIFQHADCVVARSGANTVHEIMISKVPAVFIPLPFAHMNEQYKNAQILEESGTAKIVQQQDLNQKSLFDAIKYCLKNDETMRKKAEYLSKEFVTDAAERIVALAQECHARSLHT